MRRVDPAREARKKAGLCAACGRRKPAKDKVTCRPCLERQARYNETWWKRKLRKERRR